MQNYYRKGTSCKKVAYVNKLYVKTSTSAFSVAFLCPRGTQLCLSTPPDKFTVLRGPEKSLRSIF